MKIKITKTDVVGGSVFLKSVEPLDLPEPIALACLNNGIAERVSAETVPADIDPAPAVDVIKSTPAKTGKNKGA